MKIKAQSCEDIDGLEKFLNEGIDYKGFRPENIILGITQNKMFYTVIYKCYDERNKIV